MYEIDSKTMSEVIGTCIDAKYYHKDKLKWAIENDFNHLADLYSERLGEAIELANRLKKVEWKQFLLPFYSLFTYTLLECMAQTNQEVLNADAR